MCVVYARTRIYVVSHPRVHAATYTRGHNAHNRTCAPTIYKLYARCNRSYKQFNYVYASEITRLSINGITTWRRGTLTGRPRRVIARANNKIGYLPRMTRCAGALNRCIFKCTRDVNWHKRAARARISRCDVL